VAFGELALIKVSKGSTHPGMNKGSARFDDDGDLIVVAVTEPAKGHGGSVGLKDQSNALSTGGMRRPSPEIRLLP
jgi:hypothetical protein